MSIKQTIRTPELIESDAKISAAIEQLKRSERGRYALRRFKELWLGCDEGYGACNLDSSNHHALTTLQLEAHSGRRDFLHDL